MTETPRCCSTRARTARRYSPRSHCARGAQTAGPLPRFSIRNCTVARSVARPITPPRASISRTTVPLATPPIAGLHDIWPIVSRLLVTRATCPPCPRDRPALSTRAAATAASVPACPPPTTMTSKSASFVRPALIPRKLSGTRSLRWLLCDEGQSAGATRGDDVLEGRRRSLADWLQHAFPRALRAPARPEPREEPRHAAPLDADRLAVARGTLRGLREQPRVDERRRDDAHHEEPAHEPEEDRGIAHGYSLPSTTSHRSTNAVPPSMRSMTTSVPDAIARPSTLLALTSYREPSSVYATLPGVSAAIATVTRATSPVITSGSSCTRGLFEGAKRPMPWIMNSTPAAMTAIRRRPMATFISLRDSS